MTSCNNVLPHKISITKENMFKLRNVIFRVAQQKKLKHKCFSQLSSYVLEYRRINNGNVNKTFTEKDTHPPTATHKKDLFFTALASLFLSASSIARIKLSQGALWNTFKHFLGKDAQQLPSNIQ